MGISTPTPTKAAVQRKQWTRADFRQLPEGPPFYELEDGELLEMARPRGRHQKIVGKLFSSLSTYIEQNQLGDIWPEVEVDITATKTYVPDLSYLATENLRQFADDVAIDGAPDLVVEVLSPSTGARDRSIKLQTYHQAGVSWYWIIDPDTLLIDEYKHTADGYLVAQVVPHGDDFSPGVFPGLTLNLARLMGELAEGEKQPASETDEQPNQP